MSPPHPKGKHPHPPSSSPSPLFAFEMSKQGDDEVHRANEGVEFNETPVDAHCPYCRMNIVTNVEYRSSWLTWVFTFFILLFLGWIAFCVLPFVWTLLQDSCHLCSKCGNTLSRRHRIALPSVRNHVVTVRCGSCAAVLSLRWAAVLLAMCGCVTVGLMARYYVKYIGIPDIPRGESVDVGWPEYMSQCGIRSYLGNPLHATRNFERDYYHRTVTWEGRVMKVTEGILSKHFMYLRMSPPQYPGPSGTHRPDIGLIFSKHLADKVAEIELGDLVKFDSTLIALAKRGQPHFGVMWDVDVITRTKDLPSLDSERGYFYIGGLGLAPIQHIPGLAKRIQRATADGSNPNPALQVLKPIPNRDAFSSYHIIENSASAKGEPVIVTSSADTGQKIEAVENEEIVNTEKYEDVRDTKAQNRPEAQESQKVDNVAAEDHPSPTAKEPLS